MIANTQYNRIVQADTTDSVQESSERDNIPSDTENDNDEILENWFKQCFMYLININNNETYEKHMFSIENTVFSYEI